MDQDHNEIEQTVRSLGYNNITGALKGRHWTTKAHSSSRPEVGRRIVCAVMYLCYKLLVWPT